MLLLIDSEKLPENYRWRDFVKLHGRDVQQVSERTSADSIEKALSINGQPISLKIQLDEAHQSYSVMVSDNLSDTEQSELIASAQNMLGVNQEIEAFERVFIQHPEIGHTLQTQKGLRVPQSSSFYEALTWAIIGQQINLNAAIALRRKLIQLVGLRQAKGLLCYPEAQHIASMPLEQLLSIGMSNNKAQALITVSQKILSHALPVTEWLNTKPIEEIREQLLAIKGIGPWTVNYTLLRGLGWLDGSLHGDVAVRSKLTNLLGKTDNISEKAARDWLSQFSPWRALVAAHLWEI